MAKPTTALKTAPVLTPVPAPTAAPVKRGPGRPPGAKNVAAATIGAPKARKGKPTQWSKWGKQALRFIEMNKRLGDIAPLPGVFPRLGSSLLSDESMEEIAVLVSTLQQLDADKVDVPKIPKAPKGPAFSVGDTVQVVKKFRTKYLETGLYTTGDLDLLVVVAVGKKGLLCQVDNTTGPLQVFIRYPKHLEKR